MTDTTKQVGCRKARVGENRCDQAAPWAVYQHTLYLGRWYYDGYEAFPTREEAERYAERWLKGGE